HFLFVLIRVSLCSLPPLFLLLTSTSPTDTSTLSLHDALPILSRGKPKSHRKLPAYKKAVKSAPAMSPPIQSTSSAIRIPRTVRTDRKSTRLNSSHVSISYAVFCLKKKKDIITIMNVLSIYDID